MLKKGDCILAIILVLLAAAGFCSLAAFKNYQGERERIAVIIRDGEVLRSIDLRAVEREETIKLDGQYKHVVLVEPGRIRFSEADCPDRICVRTGWLQDAGDTAACLPDKLIIKIQGRGNSVDTVAY